MESDIVWGMNITGHDYTYFLDFVKSDKESTHFLLLSVQHGMKMISQRLNRYWKNLTQLVLREEQASEWVEELLGKKSSVTCDPTMLCPNTYWRSYPMMNMHQKDKYVFDLSHNKR